METAFYVGIIERGESNFGIFFPDFPGCTSVADSVPEVAASGSEALRLHVDLMLRDGEEIPAATNPADIETDPDIDVVTPLLVPLNLPGKAVRLNVSVEESLLAAIDAAASAEGLSRSAYLAEAARQRLARN